MEILESLNQAWQAMSLIELLGVLTGILCVWFAAKQNIWTWPTGLISVGLYVIVFYKARLYADMGLNAFYFVTSLYGWYLWLYGGKNHTERKVGRVSRQELGRLLLLGLLFTAGLGYVLDNFTDADLSYPDSATTAMSLIGYWMMAKKQLENWLVWLVVDVLYVGMYLYKELYLTSFLFFVYLLIAVKGYIEWKQELEKRAEINALAEV